MKLKLDENVPPSLVPVFSDAGHDVLTAQQEGLTGSRDAVLLQAASSENRILVTLDLGFADLRIYPLGSHAGIVVFRGKSQRKSALEIPARELVNSGLLEGVRGAPAIVEQTRIRTRRPNA